MKKIQVITMAILLLVLSINILINFEKNNVKADTVVAVRDITENTTWISINSPYYINEDVTVHKGATLTIEPGVKILFNTYSRLSVNGKIIAIGTDENRITFTTNFTNPTYKSWEGIRFESEEHSIFKYCNILYSYYGIRSDDSANLTIENNLFSNNGAAIYLIESSNIEIAENNICFAVIDGIHTNRGSYINFTNNNIYVANGRSVTFFRNNNSSIENNTIISNFYGLRIDSCWDSKFCNNHIENNRRGIEIELSENNLIHSNNIINNSIQTEVEKIYYHNNKIYNNYWGDHTGNDTDNDGIWDEPYFIGNYFQDNHPRTTPNPEAGSNIPLNNSLISYSITVDKQLILPLDIINITIIVNHGLMGGTGADINLSSNVNGIFSEIEDFVNGTYTSTFTAPSKDELSDSFKINITISKKGFHYGSESFNIEVIQEPSDSDDDNTLYQNYIALIIVILIVSIIMIIVRLRRKNMNSKE